MANIKGQPDKNDILDGTPNDDVITGYSGDDTLSGGNGNDTLYGGLGNDKLWGNSGNDILIGQMGDEILSGGEGNDILSGGAGNDILKGGAGNDTIWGGAGFDIVDYSDATEDVHVGLIGFGQPDFLDGGAYGGGLGYDMTISTVEGIIGGKFNDNLEGNDKNNIIEGGRGEDTIMVVWAMIS